MKLHEFFFWLLVFFLPTQLGRHFWPDFSLVFGLRVDYLSPTVYLTDVLVVLILGLWGREKVGKLRNLKTERLKNKIKNAKVFLLVFLFFSFLVFSSLFSKNPGAALYKFLKIIEFSLLGLYIAKNRISLSIIHHPLAIAVIYSSLIAIAQFINQASLGGLFWFLGERSFNIQTPGIALADLGGRLFLRPYGTFSHPNSMAGFILVALILLLGNFKSTNQLINKLVFILGFSALVLSFSRSAWLVGLVVGLYLAITRKKYLLFASFCLLFAVLLGTSLPGISEKPVQERIQLIKFSLEMIKSNPILGVGLNNFIVVLSEFWQGGSVRTLQPAHNIYLLIASETGLVGLVIFLWFLVLTFRRLFTVHCSLFAALTAILLLGLFDHYWFTLQQNQLLATIVFGLAWSKIKS